MCIRDRSHTVYPSPSASVDETGEYLPPVFSAARSLPPQMSISLPVQTAEWALRGSGAFRVEVALHLSPAGSYAPPVSRQRERSETDPPQTTIDCPVQTLV